MGDNKPTLAEVREVIALMIERSHRGWIGEGLEIAEELLSYIDGNSPHTPEEWAEGMDKWAYIVDPNNVSVGYRGPFDTEQKAREFLATMPEKAVAASSIGRTLDRDTYVVISRAELKAAMV